MTRSGGPLAGAVGRRLESRRLPLVLAVLAVLLCLPALGVGWQLDDYFHRFVLGAEGDTGLHPMAVFSVMRAGGEVTQDYVDAGIFPWWTSNDFRLVFFRYVSVATAWLDAALWPRSAALAHAHSLLWFGAMVFAAACLYRRLGVSARVAGLAALLFAIDDAHATAAGWLANRNALVATFFGIGALWTHDRWRRQGSPAAAFLAPLSLALALAGGELALGAVGLLFAYALCLEPAGRRGRLASLAPTAGVVALWALAYRWLGFGAAGSGLYLDPAGEPVRFLLAVVERAPFYLLGQFAPVPADVGSLLPPELVPAAWWAAVAFVVLLSGALTPLVRRDREARFWALGTLLAVVPLCATFPSNRVLLFVGLGGMALVAKWLALPVTAAGPAGWLAARGFAAFLVVTHLVLAPLLLVPGSRAMKVVGEPVRQALLTLPVDDALARQDLVVVNAPDYLFYVSMAAPVLHAEGRPVPRRLRGLAIGPSEVEVRRLDGWTLEAAMAGGYLGGPLGDLYRDRQELLSAGRRLDVPGMTVTIVESRAGRPLIARFRFAEPLESPALRWVAFRDGVFHPFVPPAVGESVRLPRALGPFDLFR